MFRYYYWSENRIIVNESHHYWNHQEKSNKLGMDGSFVEKCLWIPRFAFTNVVGLSSWQPTPTQSEGPPMDVYLTRDERLEVIKSRFHVTVACEMDFSMFPFDTQVN